MPSSVRMKFADLVNKKIIDLSQKGLCDDNLDVLTKVLKKSKVLESLYLRDNQITLADGKFADALANNRTLRYLGLQSNKVGAEGAKRLADALKVNQTLLNIRFWNNQIGDDGAKHLASALMDNKSLQWMDLSENNIGDVGAQRLAASFLVNQSLRTISLENNKIGDKGAKTIANSIECNQTITILDLKMNKISGPVKEKIRRIVNEPDRANPNDEISLLAQLEAFIKKKDEQIKTLEIALASKDERIANLEADLKSPTKLIEKIMAEKDDKIASLESRLKYSKIVETVDLNIEPAEHAKKRQRTEYTI
mmetsp:Transcript_23126/g.49951  ORF Transcript_23126/g.49951 Transcript_23126/m.49951 type:complete len:309 (+) Transcript_23126:102-1028(+)